MGNYDSILKKIGFRKTELRVLFLGLDAAGKTTILYRLKLGEVVTTIPTIGFNVETIERKNIIFTAWDVGGRDKIRPLYRHYFQNTQAIFYIIDSNDRERISEAGDELKRFLREDELRDAILIVLANKQDLPDAMKVEEIQKALDFESIKQTKNIFGTIATTGEGLIEALEWLSETYDNPKKNNQLTGPLKETLEDAINLKESSTWAIYSLASKVIKSLTWR